MQRTLITAALLGGFAGLAGAEVTLYGRVDLSIAQRANAADNTELRNGSGSRLGVRGSEDLGGGLKAVFGLEHRFDADNGAAGDPFWGGKSVVGLAGSFGTVPCLTGLLLAASHIISDTSSFAFTAGYCLWMPRSSRR